MDYKVLPLGPLWNDGMFNVPASVVDKYMRLASEYQLKALLFIFRNGGQASSAQIARVLGQPIDQVDELIDIWITEGVLVADGEGSADTLQAPAPVVSEKPAVVKENKPKKEKLSAPTLTPKDVVALLREDEGLQFLLTQAQAVLGRSISHAEQEMLINMVNYYGLRVEVVLMILEFYRSEKQSGRTIGLGYINTMAKDWADSGIDTLADAEEKLKQIEKSDRLWNEVIALTGIRHRRPTEKQREMVNEWFKDFDIQMITLAVDMMKENTSEPSLPYINTIIKKWKKNGITSPSQVKAEQEAFAKSKEAKEKADGKLTSKPTYDLDNLNKSAKNNTEI